MHDTSGDPAALLASFGADRGVLLGELPETGPRRGADRGEPMTRTLVLHEAPGLEIGVWSCTPGGWAIRERSDTEIVHVLEGRARIVDADGTTRALGPGSLLVLPRGWSGRWEVDEPLRKLYVLVG